MDEANHDYGYYKVQLPYYNELFGDPTSNDYETRYGKNYTDMVVTGWDIISATPGTDISDKAGTDADGVAYDHKFNAHWESGYNFADRYCTEKDLFSKSGRVFAQGGYYYVPEGVTDITIKAHWGTAVYVRNADNSVDRINVTDAVGSGSEFTPSGKLPTTFQGQTVFTSIQNAIKDNRFSNLAAGKTVYDQAIVLVGNIQVRNGNNVVNYSGTNARPYTLMSADFDLDNEPDFCLQLQFRDNLERPRIQPVRFDFLSVPELGLAIRPDNRAWAIGIMVPAGHFEITETACMHTTQFEYDANISKVEAPVILNGGHFEQIVVRYGSTSNDGISDRTSYFIMGGHFWMKRFTPGAHTSTGSTPKIRHCAVNVIGGEFPEFYLSGIYRTITANVDNPHCYINGGRFGTIAGAGMEQISGDITFKIDHAIIDEFYGGGINASLPVLGKIDVTIDHSRVGKYCGGPKVGILGTTSDYKTVTTHATGSTFGEFYGGGNGGTSYFREQKKDGDEDFPAQSASGWNGYGYSGFNPLNTISGVNKASDKSATNKGYHAEYEFEVFNNSNGTTDKAVVRAYYQWAQFGTTATGKVTNFLKDCTVNGNFYGGGNLGNVNGDVETTLTGDTHITGSAFAAGYSASIPQFRIHDKENATTSNFPGRDFAGVITDHTLDYKKDASGKEIYYTWSNELPPGTTKDNAKDNPTFQKDGKWYCYTWESLEGLGAVSGNATITINGNCQIDGNVYGGGDESAVSGNANVTVTENATVLGNVYGGGNIGSVGTFTTADATYHTAHPEVPVGKPYACTAGGKTTVTINGNAEIGRNNMKMTAAGGADDAGMVYGAGRGTVDPLYDDPTYREAAITNTAKQAAITAMGEDALTAKLDELACLAYVNESEVTIGGNAFVKGSVYGGSENGHVLGNTLVQIEGGQIGNGDGLNRPYTDEDWAKTSLKECSHWDYEPDVEKQKAHDIFANVYDPDLDLHGLYAGGALSATDGHTFYGNVFGGGSGYYPYGPGKWLRSAGVVEGNTEVRITGGHILTSVYGGNEMTDVLGSCTVTMSGGTLGVPRTRDEIAQHPVTCYLFGAGKGDTRTNFNTWTNVGSTSVTVSGTALIYGNVFGGGEDGHVLGDAVTTIQEGSVTDKGIHYPYIGTNGNSGFDGNIFGGGRGFAEVAKTAGVVCGNVTVDITGGTMLGTIFGGGRLASVGTYLVPPNHANYGKMIPDGVRQVVGEDDVADASVTHGYITVSISGGTIGATNATTGALADSRFTIGDVYAGCKGSILSHSIAKDLGKAKHTALIISQASSDVPTVINNSIFGGGEAGNVEGSVSVNMLGGEVKNAVFGGGARADTNTSNWDADKNNGEGKAKGGWAEGKSAASSTTIVNLLGGTVGGNAYGGGLGLKQGIDDEAKDIEAYVWGNVQLNLNGLATSEYIAATHSAVVTPMDDNSDETTDYYLASDGCVVKGKLFGCNNNSGSPKGASTVHVYKTKGWTGHFRTGIDAETAADRVAALNDIDDTKHSYEVAAVYGGGNLAAYEPVDEANGTTHVIIDGCELTSIKTVYGGGNAASTPATLVDINGTYEIEEAFGGGNGKDDLPNGRPNPGANVGFKDYSDVESTYPTKEDRQGDEFASYRYGTGEAQMNIHGGKVHRVYGGSNTKGNVRISAVTMLEDESGCPFDVDEAYGGGKSAPMDGATNLVMACMPGLKAAFGGAEDANVEGNVTLNITNGYFDRVFGGNNVAGTIGGTITVNVEETGCKPIVIGQLYGGGNLAPYTAPAGEHGPTLNVRSFTSIGEVYGGGYGATAKVTGDTYVNINVCDGMNYSDNTALTTLVAEQIAKRSTISFWDYVVQNGKIKTDDDGNRVQEAKSVSLNMPTRNGLVGAIWRVFGGGNAADVEGNTNVSIGTTATETFATKAENETEFRTATVRGADIRGDVFGGGNNAEVTGNTNVVVGKN